MAEGQTATNPSTGERVVMRGGQWVPMGGQQSPVRPQAAQSRRPIQFRDDTDAVARTLLGEAGNQGEQGMLAVGGVIANRARQRGLSPSQVVLQRNQFEPWGNPETTQRLLGISADSPEYQQAYAIAQRALGGEDVTGGASHFYAPRAQAALGRAKPSWDNGTGRAIGDHLFFNLDGSAPSDAQLIGAPQSSAGPAIQEGQTATNPQTGERVVFTSGQWVPTGEASNEGEIRITQGVRNVNGRAVIYDSATGQATDAGPWEEYLANERRSQEDRVARAERLDDPEYQAAIAQSQRGSENVPERLRAVLQGASLGFGDEILGGLAYADQALFNAGERLAGREANISASMAAQAARDTERDAQNVYAAENPVENFALQLAGGVVSPASIVGGQYMGAARGADAIRRAGQVGFSTGAGAGFGGAEGNIAERLPETAIGGVAGAGLGAITQGGLNRIGQVGQGGGAARRLSRAGVDLTPGQMLAEAPVVGSAIRNLEDVAGGFNPLMAGVRQRQNEDVLRAAGNEALAPIGETLPKKARTGYKVAQEVSKTLGDRYDRVTSGLTLQGDQILNDTVDDIMLSARQTLDDSNLRRLDAVLTDKVNREFGPNDTLSGDSFKRIETALRQVSDKANRPTSSLSDNDFGDSVDAVREAMRDLVARQSPDTAEEIRNLNRGWANYKRIERAVSGSSGFTREGTPTPGELSQTVASMASNSQLANERALLQGLATDARSVLPATVPDSGTAQKTVLAGAAGALGTGAAAVMSPALAAGLATGAIVYSRPGIAALNAIYRASDSQAANVALRQLGEQAKKNPALQPYYQAAAEYVLGLSPTDTANSPQAPAPTVAMSPQLQTALR